MLSRKLKKAFARKGQIKTSRDGIVGQLEFVAYTETTKHAVPQESQFEVQKSKPRSKFAEVCCSTIDENFSDSKGKIELMKAIAHRLEDFASKVKVKPIPEGAPTIRFSSPIKHLKK